LYLAVAAAFACGLLLTLAAPSALTAATAAELQPWTQVQQPTFTLPNTAGTPVALDTERGQIVLVHFFATWCEPCREELPALNRLTARADGKVKVIAISVAESDLGVRRFFETLPVDFPVLLDRDRAVAKAWKVSSLPTTFVLDADLQPRLVTEAGFTWDAVDPAALPGVFAAAHKITAVTSHPTLKPN
jgi:peroxiredoxin